MNYTTSGKLAVGAPNSLARAISEGRGYIMRDDAKRLSLAWGFARLPRKGRKIMIVPSRLAIAMGEARQQSITHDDNGFLLITY